MKPVTSPKPTSQDACAEAGDAIYTFGGSVSEYPEPKLIILISVISPLKMVAAASAPVPPIASPRGPLRGSTMYTEGASVYPDPPVSKLMLVTLPFATVTSSTCAPTGWTIRALGGVVYPLPLLVIVTVTTCPLGDTLHVAAALIPSSGAASI